MPAKAKGKRPSKGQRTYNRRLKQSARKDGSLYHSPNMHRVPKKTIGE